MKTIFLNSIRSLILTLMLLGSFQVTAQISLLDPEPAANPNFGTGAAPWTSICAGVDGFNQYFAEISWAGNPNNDNEFILELSDANGDFTNATELARTADQNTNSSKSFEIEFAIPTDTRGDTYKIRARSTSPVDDQESADAFSMYFLNVTGNLIITDDGSGVPPGSICTADPITIQVDNIDNPESLEYIWFRSGTELTNETAHTLNVTESGFYQVFIDYGNTCTGSANTNSNIIDIVIGSDGGQGIAIEAPSNSSLCPSSSDIETLSINMTNSAWNYQWYQNGSQITGATASTYDVNASTVGFEGEYQVEISGPSICNEISPAIVITNAANYTVTRNNPASVIVIPSITQTLSVSTTALSPTYQWFRNSTAITGATNNTLDITEDGDYFAAVTQNGGSCTGTVNSENTVAVSPASFEIVIDYTTSYTSCVNTSIVLEVTTINAIDNAGGVTNLTSDLINSFSYQWQKEGSDVIAETSNNISLASTTENGDYTIAASLTTFNESSNTLPVRLLTSEIVEISSTGLVFCNTNDPITFSTTTDLSTESFSWERDGVSINTTDDSFDIDSPGIYQLVLDKDGCSLLSNEIVITTLDPALIQLDVEGDIVFPEGSSRTVTASGGTQYRWFDSNNTLMSSTNSMTFTEEGQFLLIANIDNCEISIPLNVVFLDLFNVPNVITPNGDGANDQWVIPNSFSNQEDVTVTIFNDRGITVFNETNYQNNWPSATLSLPKQNTVFYYIIKNPAEVLKQGTITVIK